MSGSPHGVRGMVQDFAALGAVPDDESPVCAATAIGRTSAAATSRTNVLTMAFIARSSFDRQGSDFPRALFWAPAAANATHVMMTQSTQQPSCAPVPTTKPY